MAGHPGAHPEYTEFAGHSKRSATAVTCFLQSHLTVTEHLRDAIVNIYNNIITIYIQYYVIIEDDVRLTLERVCLSPSVRHMSYKQSL